MLKKKEREERQPFWELEPHSHRNGKWKFLIELKSLIFRKRPLPRARFLESRAKASFIPRKIQRTVVLRSSKTREDKAGL